jgi:hypothetical protein
MIAWKNIHFREKRQNSSAATPDDGAGEECQYRGYRLIMHCVGERFSVDICAAGSKTPVRVIDYAGYPVSRNVVLDDAKQIVERLLYV